MRVLFLLLAATALAPAQDRDESWRQDLRVMTDAILNTHPNPYTRTPRESWDRAIEDLNAAIPALSDSQVKAGLARIAALANDAHTNITLTQTASGFRPYFLKLRWFDDGLFVTATQVTADHVIGAKVIAINDMPIEDAYQRVREFISYENDPWAREVSQDYLAMPDVLFAAGVIGESRQAVMTIEMPDGSTHTATVNPAPGTPVFVEGPRLARPAFPIYKRNTAAPYWYEYLQDSKSVYVQYNQCRESPALSMLAFLNEMNAKLSSEPVDRVVIDLRHNTGGNSAVLGPMVQALYYAIDQGQLPLPGGVWVIVGKRTFSSAVLNAASLKSRGARLIGEPTGGNPSWYGEVKSVTLPGSGLVMSLSTRKFDIQGFPGPFIDVDLRVPFTSRDFMADRDPWLESALSAPWN